MGGVRKAEYGCYQEGGQDVIARRYVQIYSLPGGLKSPAALEGPDPPCGRLFPRVQSGRGLLCDLARPGRLFHQKSLYRPALQKPTHTVCQLYAKQKSKKQMHFLAALVNVHVRPLNMLNRDPVLLMGPLRGSDVLLLQLKA